jgi:hypothetical protein
MRRSTLFICILVFAVVFAAHFGYHAWQEARIASQWVTLESVERPSALARYVERQDFYLGYSYALAAAFTVFAVLLGVQQRRRQVGGILGGVTLIGGLYAAGCFLIGCCGSPMLVVYLSLFGASFLGVIKPIVAAVTTLSIAVASIYVVRRSRRACCSQEVQGESSGRVSPARNEK